MKPAAAPLLAVASLFLAGCGPSPTAGPPGPPDPVRGKAKATQYGCATCHQIPGLVSRGMLINTGPALENFATRPTIAGSVPHTPENLVRWLRRPQDLVPRTAMPNLGISEADARDIAAFLQTLE